MNRARAPSRSVEHGLHETFRNTIKRGKSGGYVDMSWMWKDLLDSNYIAVHVTYGCFHKMSRARMLRTSKVQVRVHAIAHRLKSPPSFASSLPRVNIACESIIGGWFIQPPLSLQSKGERGGQNTSSASQNDRHILTEVGHQRQSMLLNWWWVL